ncbi:hypothetical protein [Streptomyces sp. bgisy100]|uniref:hypothetical protein n=1 Tax=Streptomyces sp. bgisy100 TaxID=3413783 RepID=UPI003D7318ED
MSNSRDLLKSRKGSRVGHRPEWLRTAGLQLPDLAWHAARGAAYAAGSAAFSLLVVWWQSRH